MDEQTLTIDPTPNNKGGITIKIDWGHGGFSVMTSKEWAIKLAFRLLKASGVLSVQLTTEDGPWPVFD